MAIAPAVLPAASGTDARRWWMLAALLLGQLMGLGVGPLGAGLTYLAPVLEA